MICTCEQCDSAFCAVQLTALIKPKWCVLLYCCACLHPNTILMETGWTTVPCPATNLSILISKSHARTKQSVISVALKTHLKIRLGICIYETSLLHQPDDYLVSHQAVHPTFYNKIAPMLVNNICSKPKVRLIHRTCKQCGITMSDSRKVGVCEVCARNRPYGNYFAVVGWLMYSCLYISFSFCFCLKNLVRLSVVST